MKKNITNAEVRLFSVRANDILTTSSLSVGDPIPSGSIVSGDAPARPAIFDAPAASNDGASTIWQ